MIQKRSELTLCLKRVITQHGMVVLADITRTENVCVGSKSCISSIVSKSFYLGGNWHGIWTGRNHN